MLKRPWPTITGYQKNDLEASNDSSYYYGYFDDLAHWELANGKVQNYFYDLHDQLVKAEFFKKMVRKKFGCTATMPWAEG